MLDSIFTAETVEQSITLTQLLMALGTSLLIGLFVSIVYSKTHKRAVPSQSFALTLVMLPAVVTVIILLVGNSVARAFSLAGAFSIIRFRSAPGDAKDIVYVLFCMAIGLATGMGYLAYAAIVAGLLLAVVAVLELLGFGQPKGTQKLLKITVPENLDYQHAFDGVMQKYTLSSTLCRVKTVDLGSLYELHYSIVMKNLLNEKDFMDELRCRNGNLNIVLVLGPSPGSQDSL